LAAPSQPTVETGRAVIFVAVVLAGVILAAALTRALG
jgi:hypothetical protein